MWYRAATGLTLGLLTLGSAGCDKGYSIPRSASAAEAPTAPTGLALLRAQLDELARAEAPAQSAASPIYGGYLEAADGPASYSLALEAGRCFTVVAAAEPELHGAELAVYDPRDRRLAVDAREGGKLRVAQCAGAAGRYRAELKVKEGHGEVALRAFAGEISVTIAPKGPRVRAEAPKREGDALATAIADEASRSAPGTRQVQRIFRGPASAENTDWNLHLERQCYVFVGYGMPKVKELGLYLWDPSNKKVEYKRSSTNAAVMQYCATTPGPYRLRGQQNDGQGDYGVGVYARR